MQYQQREPTEESPAMLTLGTTHYVKMNRQIWLGQSSFGIHFEYQTN